MKSNLILSDANILIDLANLNLLEAFTQLNFISYTTDFVLNELNIEQQKLIGLLVQQGKMQIISSDNQDILAIYQLIAKVSGLSVQDCSVWYHFKKINATMLTGDRKLRKEAESDNIVVRGILFVLDELLQQHVLNFDQALYSIKQLQQSNNRLPNDEINRRIAEWSKEN